MGFWSQTWACILTVLLTSCMAMDWKLLPSQVQFPHFPTAAVKSSWKDCWETEWENTGFEAGTKPGTLC